MKSLHFIFFCLITIALYFFSLSQIIASPASASSTFCPGRRMLRDLPISLPNPNNKDTCHKIQGINDKAKQSTADVSTATKYATSIDNFDEIVYHIDYHGVMTHPTPTPKHPKP